MCWGPWGNEHFRFWKLENFKCHKNYFTIWAEISARCILEFSPSNTVCSCSQQLRFLLGVLVIKHLVLTLILWSSEMLTRVVWTMEDTSHHFNWVSKWVLHPCKFWAEVIQEAVSGSMKLESYFIQDIYATPSGILGS